MHPFLALKNAFSVSCFDNSFEVSAVVTAGILRCIEMSLRTKYVSSAGLFLAD